MLIIYKNRWSYQAKATYVAPGSNSDHTRTNSSRWCGPRIDSSRVRYSKLSIMTATNKFRSYWQKRGKLMNVKDLTQMNTKHRLFENICEWDDLLSLHVWVSKNATLSKGNLLCGVKKNGQHVSFTKIVLSICRIISSLGSFSNDDGDGKKNVT